MKSPNLKNIPPLLGRHQGGLLEDTRRRRLFLEKPLEQVDG